MVVAALVGALTTVPAAAAGTDPIVVVATGIGGAQMDVDDAGNLYVLDDDAVVRIAAGTTTIEVVAGGNGPGIDADQLDHPLGLAVGDDGTLFVSDTWNRRIMRWRPGATAGEQIATLMEEPAQLTLGDDGWLYWASTLEGDVFRTHVVDDRTEPLTGGDDRPIAPHGLALDAAGNVYASDLHDARVVRWSPDTRGWTTVAGGDGHGQRADQFSSPSGLAVDAAGMLYVADGINGRVQRWAPGATAGVTVAGGDGWGLGLHQLAQPCDVALGPAGELFVTDCRTERVIRWPAPPPPAGFPDVAPGAFHAHAVDWAAHLGVTTGVGATGRFAPDSSASRAEAVTMLWRMAVRPAGHGPHWFVDVPAGAFYALAVDWAAATGITTGFGGDPSRFAPGTPLTRAQAIVVLWRWAGTPGGRGPHGFADVAPGTYYEEALRWATAERITRGVGTTGRFEPDRPVTRGELVVLLRRLAWTPTAWADPTLAPPTVLF